jgi:hypothetical protein
LKGHTGRIRITTTTAKAGNGTKGIGTASTTTTAIGATMIVGGGMVITTTVGMSTKTDRSSQQRGLFQKADELACSTLRHRRVKPKA